MRDKTRHHLICEAEERRIAALRDYAILDTPPEAAFDDLVLLASHVCETPMALITLVDQDRQWFKARLGVAAEGTPLSQSFCVHLIDGKSLMVVPDATQDPRFASNPFVTGDQHLRFYAGAPLITASGAVIGALCVGDRVPRVLRPEQGRALQALARQVVSQLELRRAANVNAMLAIRAERDSKRRMRHALRDPLTRLANRASLAQHIRECLEQARSETPACGSSAVLMIDLDRFKQVNDMLGHGVGDAVLRRIAHLLRGGVRTSHRRSGRTGPPDIVGRLGGDEFVVLLNDLRAPADASIVASRIVDLLAEPLEFDGHTVRIGASVGIANIEARHEDVHAVLREADAALYAAQAAGKSCYCVFDAAMHAATVREMMLERDLRDLLSDTVIQHRGGEFVLHYQPIVDVTTRKCTGFEALVRWNHPELCMISPGEFIPIAENAELIVPLGAWVMSEACAQLARWSRQDPALAKLAMNVNVARRQLVDPDFVPQVARLLEAHGIEPSRLKLEITESSVMHDPEAASRALGELRKLGVALYMDDFGTGHSSLGCLKRFPLDGLKIDRSFVSMMAQSAESDAIVRAVLDLARCFNMKVTAEGVENSEQWWMLRKFGCQSAQGYYFARPLVADEAAKYVLLEAETSGIARAA